jgi:hypothetical protein
MTSVRAPSVGLPGCSPEGKQSWRVEGGLGLRAPLPPVGGEGGSGAAGGLE